MKRDVLKSVVDSLLNKFYSFAHCIIPDELQAEQLIIDSYSIFLMKAKKELDTLDVGPKDNKVKIHIRRMVLQQMLETIYELGMKRYKQLGADYFTSAEGEFTNFYKLPVATRAVVFLHEVLEFSMDDICDILSMDSHIALENFYNATSLLVPQKENKHWSANS